ncbi:MAG: ABC transporter ATP-binding protein [Thermodesulfovibrionales bacterium]
MHLLEVRGLNISFISPHAHLRVVSDLGFHIGHGEVFGLVGESGCGKSITAYSIMGLLPDMARADGEIIFKGRDLLALHRGEMRRMRGKDISMIFQEPMTSLNPVLTVGYQIAEVLTTHAGMSRTEARDAAVALLRTVKIPSPELRVREYPHQMSGGMRQRIMIAMAIACKPALLIADEPTTALDVTIQAEILKLLRDLEAERRMSVLFISHDLAIISEITQRVGVMYGGRIVETGLTEEILRAPRHPYTKGLLDSLPVSRERPLTPIPGTVPSPAELPQGCKFSNRCRYVLEKCLAAEPELIGVGANHFSRCIRIGEIPWNSSR